MLATAAKQGHLDAVKVLLDAKAPLLDLSGEPSAAFLAAEQNHPAVVKTLLAAGGDPWAAIAGWIAGGHNRALQEALKAIATDVEPTLQFGRTAVMTALYYGNVAAIDILAAANYPFDRKNADGETNLAFARRQGIKLTAAVQKRLQELGKKKATSRRK